MVLKRINSDYIKSFSEMPYHIAAHFKKNKNRSIKSNSILIINTCILLGDYLVSLPVIREFIKKTNLKVDMVVSPAVYQITTKIRGIGKVYVAKTIESVNNKNHLKIPNKFDNYDTIIVIRINQAAYNLLQNISFRKINTHVWHYIKYYGFNMIKNNLTRKYPKQMRVAISEILLGKLTKRELQKVFDENNFEEIFCIPKSDYNKLKKFHELNTNKKIVLIHTGTNWYMKKWENNKWEKLIKKINKLKKFRFIFIGTENEKEDYDIISKKINFKLHSLIGKTTTYELMLVMRRCNYFIGIDSGPRNMAHLSNLRTLILLGPGPHIFMPLNKNDKIIDKSNGKGLYQMYWGKKTGFIDMITVDDAYKGFKSLIKS